MAKASGFITLHRQIMDWEWYHDANTFNLFVRLLLMANYVDGSFEGKLVKRGQVATSLRTLSTHAGLSLQQTRTALDHLQTTHEITYEPCRRHVVITIVNYDKYQTPTQEPTRKQHTINTKSNTQSTHEATFKQQQYNNNNNINNGTNITKEQEERGSAQRFTPPTKEEVFSYCMDERYGIDVDRFYAYYESVGWKIGGKAPMRDWKAAVRSWALRDKKNGEQSPAKVPKKVTAQEYTQRDYGDEDREAMALMLKMGGYI